MSEKFIKILLLFPTTDCVRPDFLILNQTTYHNKVNVKVVKRIQVSSIKPDTKDFQDCKMIPLF